MLPNLKMRAALLLLLLTQLAGCGFRQATLQPGLLPAMPELPASARQWPTPPECFPTCLEAWKLKAEQWQKSLSEQGLQEVRASEPMTE